MLKYLIRSNRYSAKYHWKKYLDKAKVHDSLIFNNCPSKGYLMLDILGHPVCLFFWEVLGHKESHKKGQVEQIRASMWNILGHPVFHISLRSPGTQGASEEGSYWASECSFASH